ncbi:hypothetical protein EIP91_002024 [Steccherinum ochraceum]|uniref:Uncharacterized protein n=1 Tax=Steccherinum ochraceum TaxID=92696 RepID=A0A4R0RLC2_9APHY|nr:hypothetical protein EIP91_002024 [Steccherinum ochraceum]
MLLSAVYLRNPYKTRGRFKIFRRRSKEDTTNDDEKDRALAFAWMLEMSTKSKQYDTVADLLTKYRKWPLADDSDALLSDRALTAVLQRFAVYVADTDDPRGIPRGKAVGSFFLRFYWQVRQKHPTELPTWDRDFGVKFMRTNGPLFNRICRSTLAADKYFDVDYIRDLTILTIARPRLTTGRQPSKWKPGLVAYQYANGHDDNSRDWHRILLFLAQESTETQYFDNFFQDTTHVGDEKFTPYSLRILLVLNNVSSPTTAASDATLVLAFVTVLGFETAKPLAGREDWTSLRSGAAQHVSETLKTLAAYIRSTDDEEYDAVPEIAQRLDIQKGYSGVASDNAKTAVRCIIELWTGYLAVPTLSLEPLSLDQLLDIDALRKYAGDDILKRMECLTEGLGLADAILSDYDNRDRTFPILLNVLREASLSPLAVDESKQAASISKLDDALESYVQKLQHISIFLMLQYTRLEALSVAMDSTSPEYQSIIALLPWATFKFQRFWSAVGDKING